MSRWIAPGWWLWWAVALPASGWAQSATVSEHALKSALFFKLPQFVYRADEVRDKPFAVCLLGGAAYAAPFEKLAQSPIDGRAVDYSRLSSVNDAGRCDFVFVAQAEAGPVDVLVKRLSGFAGVSVSDVPGFARAGGMVELSLGGAGTPVSILINRKAARAQGIEFNAQLLRLAKVVEP